MKIKPEERATVRKLVDEGKTIREVADKYGVTYQAIRHILTQTGKEDLKQRVSRPSEDVLYQLYILEERSQKDIAKLLGVGASSVCRWLKDAEIEQEKEPMKIPEDMKEKYEYGGYSARALSELYDVPEDRVRYWLQTVGARKRTFPKRRKGYHEKMRQLKGAGQ